MQKYRLFLLLVIGGLAAFAAYLMLLGSGFFHTPPMLAWLGLSLLLLAIFPSSRAFYWLGLPIISLYALYAPIGLTFGPPSYQYVASVFATDLQESREFFGQIPLWHYAAGIAILACVWLGHQISQRNRLDVWHMSLFRWGSIITLFCATPAFQFLGEGGKAIQAVVEELHRLNRLSMESRWPPSTIAEGGYEDYVLIIGESARKDYHHAYGYPIANTPFMSSANGTLIDGLTAGGTNTIASLKLMLTKPNTEKWEGDYGLTLVDMVKSAGIKTYWLSNQGYLGQYATPISSIANKSDVKFFLKSEESFAANAQNTSDFELLPKFASVLAEPHSGKRFIVLHLYGSHPVTCDRLTDYPKLFNESDIAPKYANVNCYISSIRKTDALLEKVYHQLQQHMQQSGRRFSMIYFADHGLAHQISEENIVIHNSSGKSKLHFDVPLFKVSSDDTQRREYRVFKSGLNFTEGIATWMGIHNPLLNPKQDLFHPESDASDYGLKQIIDRFEVEPDPAVVIPQP